MVRRFAHVSALPLVVAWFVLNRPVAAFGISSTAAWPAKDVSLHLAQDQRAFSPVPRAPALAYSVVIQGLSTLAGGPFTLGTPGSDSEIGPRTTSAVPDQTF